jgi:hypothetical protein
MGGGDDVHQLITVRAGTVTSYDVWLRCETESSKDAFETSFSRKRDETAKRAYGIIIEQLRRTVAARVYTTLLERTWLGEPIKIAGLLLSPDGFAQEGKRPETIRWSDFAGAVVGGQEVIVLQIFRLRERGRPKRACSVHVDMLHGWVLPPLIEEHARRYGTPR